MSADRAGPRHAVRSGWRNMAASRASAAARQVLSQFVAARAATMSAVVHRAADRGEIPAATDAGAVIQTVTAQLYYPPFVTGEPLGPAVADRAAAIATAAARAGALTAALPGESPGDAR